MAGSKEEIGQVTRRRFLKRSIAGAVVAVVAGVGGFLALQQQPQPSTLTPTPAPTPAAVPKPQPTPTLEPALIEKAKSEGKVTVYHPWLEEVAAKVGKGFKDKFGVEFEQVRGSPSDMATRYMTEHRAGKYIMDVALGSGPMTMPGLEEDVFVRYISPEAAVYPANLKDPGGRWYVPSAATVGIAYNTEKVKGNDIPKSHGDILEPRFKDNVGARHPAGYSYIYRGVETAVGKDKFDSWLQGLAKQNPKVSKSGGEDYAFLKGGEVKVNIASYLSRILEGITRGDPVEFVRRSGTVLAESQLAAIYNNAPHPNAARLFVNYLLSEDGQKTIQAMGVYVNMRPGMASHVGEGVGVGTKVEVKDMVHYWPYTRKDLEEVEAKVKKYLG